jgi:hypothetical protein
MRRNLDNNSRSWSWLFDIAKREVTTILLKVIVLSSYVGTADSEDSAVGSERGSEFNLITSQVSITDECLTGLVDIEALRKLLSSQIN